MRIPAFSAAATPALSKNTASASPLFGAELPDALEKTEVFTPASRDELEATAHQAVVQSAITGNPTRLSYEGVAVEVKPYKMSPQEVVEAYEKAYAAKVREEYESSGQKVRDQLESAIHSFCYDFDEVARMQMTEMIAPQAKELLHVGRLKDGNVLVLARRKEPEKYGYTTSYHDVYYGKPRMLQKLALKDGVGQWGNGGYAGTTQDGKTFYFPGFGMQDAPSGKTGFGHGNDKLANWAKQLSGILEMPSLRENPEMVRQIIFDGQATGKYKDFSRKH